MPARSPPWRPAPISALRPRFRSAARCCPAAAPNKNKHKQNKTDESGDTETRKVVNDAIAYIRSLAALNGRNADWAAEAVRSAVSLPAADALSLHVIDAIADNVPDLLRQDRWPHREGRRQA